VGDLRFTAIPAVDGLGDPQVSWVISDRVSRIAHFGDALWLGKRAFRSTARK